MLRGIAHCFVSTYEHALEFIELGFLLSFNGIVTFLNAKDTQELATKIPLENIVLETDAPFLAPTPFRGKRNEPAYVRYIAEKIAELKGVSYEEVCEVTSRNVEAVFGKL
jgi:TatD DNase family protein